MAARISGKTPMASTACACQAVGVAPDPAVTTVKESRARSANSAAGCRFCFCGMRARSALATVAVEGAVLHRQDGVAGAATRELDRYFVAFRLLEQRARQGRVNADQALGGIRFIRADDAVFLNLARIFLKPHPGAEEDARGIIRRAVHDQDIAQPLLEIAHAPVNLAQLFLAVDVLRVFRTVAERRGLRHRLRHLRALDLPQIVELRAQALRAFRRYVSGSGGWRQAVSAHEWLQLS